MADQFLILLSSNDTFELQYSIYMMCVIQKLLTTGPAAPGNPLGPVGPFWPGLPRGPA